MTPEMLAVTATVEEIPIDVASDLLGAFEELDDLPQTERQAITLRRVGQGIFRKNLVEYWKGCAVTGADCIPLLRASHIKPWRESTNVERLDVLMDFFCHPTSMQHLTLDTSRSMSTGKFCWQRRCLEARLSSCISMPK